MKKLLSLILALCMLCAVLAACGESSSDGQKTDAATEAPAPKVADDLSVMGMSYAPPAGYTAVNRSFTKGADGAVTEKNMAYTLPDGTEVTFAMSVVDDGDMGQKLLKQFGEEKVTVRDVAGMTFYTLDYEGEIYSIAQKGKDVYGIRCTPAAEGADLSGVFEAALNSVSFSDSRETPVNPDGLYDVRYTLGGDLTVITTYDEYEEAPDGAATSKAYTWSLGKDGKADLRFQIRVQKNKKLADELAGIKLDEGETMPEKTYNGLTYTVRQDDKGVYQCYIQHGSDVYVFKNLAVSSGWFASRSEESYTVFETFMNSVSFGD